MTNQNRAVPPVSETALPACLDPQSLARLHELDPDGHNKLVERVIDAYLKSLDKLVPELQKARQTPPDFNVMRHVCHTLKSSSAALGALQLSERCAEVEQMVRNGQTGGIETRLDLMLEGLAEVQQALTTLLKSQQ
ncbi:HPt (histidine-containing phosphotransfer) domain-containing protein [Paucibacter oligotrophus]|uniref:HPt (Histidine-containing phosphotransfer) domain-containing protein n=1 Tax=Roseateles oligotrophus TaxID=1769250 RepID=A0A840L733_9BURK|nr:Hpt domain-containing protein [Roseateles oligotrophus]MBB4843591.1 HPt (histidine-containing phosphotransfer) domain-containing protein [Roseateles oligotrophus]